MGHCKENLYEAKETVFHLWIFLLIMYDPNTSVFIKLGMNWSDVDYVNFPALDVRSQNFSDVLIWSNWKPHTMEAYLMITRHPVTNGHS